MATPHDEFFRFAFSQPGAARDLLRNAVPSKYLEQVALNSLSIESPSFPDEESHPQAADLLIGVVLREAKGQESDPSRQASSLPEVLQFPESKRRPEAFIYILFEHKSYADANTPLQLLRYMTRIWDRYRAENESGLLPPILPIVVFHGSAAWSGPYSFGESVASHGRYIPHVPDFTPVIFDLVATADNTLSGDFEARFAMRLLKYTRENWRRVAVILAEGESRLGRDDERAAFVRAGIRYTQAVSTPEAYASIMNILKEARTPMVEKEFGSAAEAFEKRGRIEEKQQVLIRHLSRKFGLLEEERPRITATSDPEKLDAALDAVLFAESKAEVLQHLDETR